MGLGNWMKNRFSSANRIKKKYETSYRGAMTHYKGPMKMKMVQGVLIGVFVTAIGMRAIDWIDDAKDRVKAEKAITHLVKEHKHQNAISDGVMLQFQESVRLLLQDTDLRMMDIQSRSKSIRRKILKFMKVGDSKRAKAIQKRMIQDIDFVQDNLEAMRDTIGVKDRDGKKFFTFIKVMNQFLEQQKEMAESAINPQ